MLCQKRRRVSDAPERWAHAAPVPPGDDRDLAWLGQFPLSTRGRNIVNTHGERFKLRGVNWYGASDAYHVVGGLDVQSLDTICQTVEVLGFSVVRLPFSNEMLRRQPAPGSIDYDLNPRLRGLSALEVLDEVIRCLGRHRVAVILNNHTTYGEWCGGPDRNGLWFSPGSAWTEEQWLEDWAMLATRYLHCAHVVGYDLRNEVRFCPASPGLRGWLPHWPSREGGYCAWLWGGSSWTAAARAAVARLKAVSPHGLVVVERIVWPSEGLRRYAASPGPLLPQLGGRLVLAVHHYGWTGPGRYLPPFGVPKSLMCPARLLRAVKVLSPQNYGDMRRDQLFKQLSSEWGYLLEEDICPVWVSEFGASDSDGDLRFFRMFTEYLAAADADWAYWPLNVGPKPASGGDEPYGMITPEWTPKPGGDRRLALLGLAGPASQSDRHLAGRPVARPPAEVPAGTPGSASAENILPSAVTILSRPY